MAPVKEAMRRLDGRFWTALGTVMDRQGGQHFELHDGADITVDVELHPSGRVITCRIAGAGGGAGRGAWGIPDPGDEVAVIVPDGEEDAGGIVVGTLSSGAVPPDTAPATWVVQAPTVIIVGGDVQLGASGLTAALDGVVTARGIDPFTGSTYDALNNASSVVKAKRGA